MNNQINRQNKIFKNFTRSLFLCVCFVERCLSFCTFSFGHCVVCSSSIHGFWLPLRYLHTLCIYKFVLQFISRFKQILHWSCPCKKMVLLWCYTCKRILHCKTKFTGPIYYIVSYPGQSKLRSIPLPPVYQPDILLVSLFP